MCIRDRDIIAHLYNYEIDGKIVIDDEMKKRIDVYKRQPLTVPFSLIWGGVFTVKIIYSLLKLDIGFIISIF